MSRHAHMVKDWEPGRWVWEFSYPIIIASASKQKLRGGDVTKDAYGTPFPPAWWGRFRSGSPCLGICWRLRHEANSEAHVSVGPPSAMPMLPLHL